MGGGTPITAGGEHNGFAHQQQQQQQQQQGLSGLQIPDAMGCSPLVLQTTALLDGSAMRGENNMNPNMNLNNLAGEKGCTPYGVQMVNILDQTGSPGQYAAGALLLIFLFFPICKHVSCHVPDLCCRYATPVNNGLLEGIPQTMFEWGESAAICPQSATN
jgi:hypothetical protein